MWAHLLRRMMSPAFKLWELYAGPRLATRVRQGRLEFAGEVFLQPGSTANRRAQFIADQRRQQTPQMLRIEEMDIVNRLVLAGVVLAGIHVCGVSRAFAQDKAAPPTGMVVKSGANSSDQQWHWCTDKSIL